jgi:hypothetical protein
MLDYKIIHRGLSDERGIDVALFIEENTLSLLVSIIILL